MPTRLPSSPILRPSARLAGRVCAQGDCNDCCSRVLLDGLATAAECNRMLYLASDLLPPPDERTFNLFLKLTAAAGALPAHIQFVRLVERLRRTVAREYGLPLRTLSPRQVTVLPLVRTQPSCCPFL